MGVDYDYYLFVGINLVNEEYPFDGEWAYETLEDEIHGVPGTALDCIFDGMSRKHILLGKIIARADECTEEIQEIKTDLTRIEEDVAVLLNKWDPMWRSKYGPVKMALVTHVS